MPVDTSLGKQHFFDDFLMDTINLDFYTLNVDAGGTSFAIEALRGGVIRGAVDLTDNDLTNLFGSLNWRANSGGPTTIEVRATTRTSIADGEMFIGWTGRAGTDENPITVGTTDVQTNNSPDAAGFAYTGAGTADWKMVAVNNSATPAGSPTRANTGGATTPVVGTWQTFKVVLNEDGDANFFINGVFHGRIASALRATVDLCVGVCLQSGGTARSLDIDYIDMWGGRVSP